MSALIDFDVLILVNFYICKFIAYTFDLNLFNHDEDKGNKIKFGKINPCPN
jgi:hypothetical protein